MARRRALTWRTICMLDTHPFAPEELRVFRDGEMVVRLNGNVPVLPSLY
jgi:hypothetical protein